MLFWELPGQAKDGETNLENRLRIRPEGVVSKKLIGDRKIANAIRSCSFREAWIVPVSNELGLDLTILPQHTYLDRTEDPQNESLKND